MVGRELYSLGYTKGGPGGRTPGALLCDVSQLVLFGIAAWGAANMAKLPSLVLGYLGK
jgi:hypothetical protein